MRCNKKWILSLAICPLISSPLIASSLEPTTYMSRAKSCLTHDMEGQIPPHFAPPKLADRPRKSSLQVNWISQANDLMEKALEYSQFVLQHCLTFAPQEKIIAIDSSNDDRIDFADQSCFGEAMQSRIANSDSCDPHAAQNAPIQPGDVDFDESHMLCGDFDRCFGEIARETNSPSECCPLGPMVAPTVSCVELPAIGEPPTTESLGTESIVSEEQSSLSTTADNDATGPDGLYQRMVRPFPNCIVPRGSFLTSLMNEEYQPYDIKLCERYGYRVTAPIQTIPMVMPEPGMLGMSGLSEVTEMDCEFACDPIAETMKMVSAPSNSTSFWVASRTTAILSITNSMKRMAGMLFEAADAIENWSLDSKTMTVTGDEIR